MRVQAGDRVKAVATRQAIEDGWLDEDYIWPMVCVAVVTSPAGRYTVCVKERAPEQAYSFDEEGVSDEGFQYELHSKLRPLRKPRIRLENDDVQA